MYICTSGTFVSLLSSNKWNLQPLIFLVVDIFPEGFPGVFNVFIIASPLQQSIEIASITAVESAKSLIRPLLLLSSNTSIIFVLLAGFS